MPNKRLFGMNYIDRKIRLWPRKETECADSLSGTLSHLPLK
jgi:hypothetical protein